MKLRESQIALRLDDLPEAGDEWCEGTWIAYLGGKLRLKLVTGHGQVGHEEGVLHLPLPPEATPRQIRDAAEAWLRREAMERLHEAVERIAADLRIPMPALRLSFSARSHWVRLDPRGLCCNWRLVEQPPAVIEQALRRVLATMAPKAWVPDLFAMA